MISERKEFNFDNLKFKTHIEPRGYAHGGEQIEMDGGIQAIYYIPDTNYKLSIVAGVNAHSIPRTYSTNPDEFNCFEIALFNLSTEDFATRKFMPSYYEDDVVDELSREEIEYFVYCVKHNEIFGDPSDFLKFIKS